MTVQNLWCSRRLQRWVILTLIFLLAFLPRAIYPVSRAMLWYERAIHFGDALLAQDWGATYQSYHPGVPTMWLAGIGLKLFAWGRGLSSDQLLGLKPTQPGTMNDAIAAGVMPMALVIALCITLSYPLLNRIAGRKVALAGSFLLAVDPFHLSYSKVLHVDALLATFMFTSTLFLLSYLGRARWLDLVLSGIFAGLAFLSKSPSWFLLPYTALLVGMDRLAAGLGAGGEARAGRRQWLHHLWDIVRPLLTWGGVAAVVFVMLWPVMWVKPFDALHWMLSRTIHHVEDVHPNPVFFNGQATLEDPGLSFYLATIAWKTTLVTLPMVGAALAFALLRPRRGKHNKVVWSLAVYAICFTIVMGLARFKQLAYLLPVFPALDVAAALGLAHSAEAIAYLRPWRKRRWLPTALVVLVLRLQVGIVLPHHPYYGTHHNHLLGGSRVAQHILPLQNQGEGLDLAAQYLNTQPHAQQARALVYDLGARVFRHSFLGFTITGRDPWINYRVYYANQVQRHLGGREWEEAWNADQQTTPLWSAVFDRVTYVWVYGNPPQAPAAGGPEYEVNYQLGEHIALKQVRLSAETLAAGDSLVVALTWQSETEIKEDYNVFSHLLSASGELVAQRDGPPIYGLRPTSTWRAEEVIEDSYEVFLGSDLAPGEYELSVGMYDVDSMERLPAYSSAGEPLPEDRIVLGSVRITAPGASGK
jgi:4-amino-4-deoxy-L-arabinose transferase-like glycosyltransferase